jgi:hypothetical protein
LLESPTGDYSRLTDGDLRNRTLDLNAGALKVLDKNPDWFSTAFRGSGQHSDGRRDFSLVNAQFTNRPERLLMVRRPANTRGQ